MNFKGRVLPLKRHRDLYWTSMQLPSQELKSGDSATYKYK